MVLLLLLSWVALGTPTIADTAGPAQLASAWDDLAGPDAPRAVRAVWALVDAARNPQLSTTARVAWLVAVAVLPGVGALVYVAVPGRTRLRLGGQ